MVLSEQFQRMQKLAGIISEITINKPNPLPQLRSLKAQINAPSKSIDHMERLALGVKCAELVLFIFEEKFPTDKRPRKAIEATKAYIADPTDDNEDNMYNACSKAFTAGENASTPNAYDASEAAYAAYVISSAPSYAVTHAIEAAEEYYTTK